MKEYWTYIVVLSLFLFCVIGTGIICVLFRSCGLDSKHPPAVPQSSLSTTSSAQVPTPLGAGDPTPTPEIVTGILGAPGTLLSAGTGTTTLRAQTPFNDILIAETGSEYGALRNARYNIWPYPGEIRFKEIYLVLPDIYEPVFSGYSNSQFTVSSDGQKQVVLYLRHKKNVSVGADTEVYIQAPIETDEADHPITLLESSDSGAVYSLIAKGQEVLVEVTYRRAVGLSTQQASSAHAELLRAIERMELVW